MMATSTCVSTSSSVSVSSKKLHALITGPPGVGKTTLVRCVCDRLLQQGVKVHGFYTEEVRERVQKGRGPRIGFDVVSFDGQRNILARVPPLDHGGDGPFVGKYKVSLQSFEQVALPILSNSLKKDSSSKENDSWKLVVIDEIGKMELFSDKFASAVKELFKQDHVTIMATVPLSKGRAQSLVTEIKQRKDCVLFEVNEFNRDFLVEEVARFLHHS